MTVADASTLGSILEREVLPLVAKPHRYVGHEIGIVRKAWDAVGVRFLFCYPDVYEVGMSHMGTQILYHVVNGGDDWLMERAYAPWPDMEARMRERGLPLFSLESRRPARDFDVVGFTLQSELTYTNILSMLDLAGLAIRREGRRAADPIVVAGGPCASNPEPLADFIDAFVLGDAEDAIREILAIVAEEKGSRSGAARRGGDRDQLLRRLATEVRGVYVPAFYAPAAGAEAARPRDPGVPFPVIARTVPVLRAEDHPSRMVVPLAGVTHERLPIEVQRGCVRGCRFCQAGFLYRPARERDVAECAAIAEAGLDHGGNEEVSLLSLSTADHSQIEALVDRVSRIAAERGVAVALPSLRADAFSVGLAEAASRVRRTGFTFAPEAGSERLRNVINKGLSERDILGAIECAMAAGWRSVKLYFMIGHPTEQDADFEEMARLVGAIRGILRRYPGTRVTLSVSPLVPKPHTPFQWERQDSLERTRSKLRWVKKHLAGGGVDVKHHDVASTAVEGIISRGGRETGSLIEGAWRRGARFDGWTEHLRLDAWLGALAEQGLTLEDRFRERRDDEALPWEVASYRIPRGYFMKERRRAYAAAATAECKVHRCSACGVCDFEVLQNRLAAEAERAVGPVPAVASLGDTPSLRTPRTLHRVSTIRLRYAKGSALRFLSHLDVLKELIRTLRRARAPLVYSQGFMPRPRVSAAMALATGWTSASEWVDLELAGEWDAGRLARLLEALNQCAAAGLRFLAAGVLRGHVSLAAAIERTAYRATLPVPPFEPAFAALDVGCRAFLARDAVPFVRERARTRRTVDLRPLVHDLTALDGATVVLELRTASDGSAKPTEVLEAAYGVPRHLTPLVNIHKTGTWLAGGASPLDGCEVTAGDDSVETGDSDQWEPAGDPRGHSGGRHPR